MTDFLVFFPQKNEKGEGGQEEAFFRDEGSFAKFDDRDSSPSKLREGASFRVSNVSISRQQ